MMNPQLVFSPAFARSRSPAALPRRTLLWVAGVLAIATACTPGAQGSESTPTKTDKASDAKPPAAGFEVHEWGLLFGKLGGPSLEAAVATHLVPKAKFDLLGLGGGRGGGLGLIGSGMGGGKPLLWFHLDEGVESIDVDVTVRSTRGAIAEVWPGPWEALDLADSAIPNEMRWPKVHVTRGTCPSAAYPVAQVAFGEIPAPGSPCITTDEVCEATTLVSAETLDADCAEVGGVRFNNLFYRGTFGTLADLPVEVSLAAGADANDIGRAALQLRKLDHGVALGSVFRLTRRAGLPTLMGAVPASALANPVVMPIAEQPLDLDAFFAPLTESGLSTDEKAAFRRTWEAALTDPMQPQAAEIWPEPSWDAIFVWVDASALDPIAPLGITPTPRKIERIALARITTATEADYRASASYQIAAIADGGKSEGPIGATRIVKTLQAARGKLELCNEIHQSSLSQRTLALTISDLGQVTTASIHDGSGGSKRRLSSATALRDPHSLCIADLVSSISFPVPSMNSSSTATVVFTATP